MIYGFQSSDALYMARSLMAGPLADSRLSARSFPTCSGVKTIGFQWQQTSLFARLRYCIVRWDTYCLFNCRSRIIFGRLLAQ